MAWGVPLAGYVGGGYAEDLSDLVDRHLSLFLAANELWGEAARGAEGGPRRLLLTREDEEGTRRKADCAC